MDIRMQCFSHVQREGLANSRRCCELPISMSWAHWVKPHSFPKFTQSHGVLFAKESTLLITAYRDGPSIIGNPQFFPNWFSTERVFFTHNSDIAFFAHQLTSRQTAYLDELSIFSDSTLEFNVSPKSIGRGWQKVDVVANCLSRCVEHIEWSHIPFQSLHMAIERFSTKSRHCS